MNDLDALAEQFTAAVNTFHETAPPLEAAAETAALFLLAGHALAVAPEATHMLLESSDQGNYMCPPTHLMVGNQTVARAEWDTYSDEHVDDLSDAASWLTWGHQSWEQYLDAAHQDSNARGGYYVLDLRQIKGAMA